MESWKATEFAERNQLFIATVSAVKEKGRESAFFVPKILAASRNSNGMTHALAFG